MAFSAVRSLSGVSLRLARNVPGGLGARSTAMSPYCNQIERGFKRSLWHLSSQTKPLSNQSDVSKRVPWTKMCGCCGLHTAGDKDLADFLTEEINMEKKNVKTSDLPKIRGFEISKVEGSEITLTHKTDTETVLITFNVNDSVEDYGAEYGESQQHEQQQQPEDDGPEMVSRPPFTVEINKGGDSSLAMHCIIPVPEPQEQQPQEGEEGYEDLLQISDIAILNGGKWEDSTYLMSGSLMDGNLYDMLLNMLEERGITGHFVNDLVDFSTAYEHKKYIGLLEELKDFVSCAK